jgi:hypothetical protein
MIEGLRDPHACRATSKTGVGAWLPTSISVCHSLGVDHVPVATHYFPVAI